MPQIVRLTDTEYPSQFNIPFRCKWATMKDGELRIVMHETQLRELAEAVEAAVADLPKEGVV